MAKTKATTVKVRVAVVYDGEGDYQAGGYSLGAPLGDSDLIDDAKHISSTGSANLPHACIVEIELPIPKPLVGKVLSVKAVKP